MGVVYLNTREPKVLEQEKSTSIICSRELLDRSSKLTKVAALRDNIYYHVGDTNVCIMYVEEGFCILTDYKVTIYNQPGVMCSLPNLLTASHYGVYQTLNSPGGSRDWVKTRQREN